VQRKNPGIQFSNSRQVLTPALDFQLILKFENGTATRKGPQLGILLRLFGKIVENAQTGPGKLPIGLEAIACTEHLFNRPASRQKRCDLPFNKLRCQDLIHENDALGSAHRSPFRPGPSQGPNLI